MRVIVLLVGELDKLNAQQLKRLQKTTGDSFVDAVKAQGLEPGDVEVKILEGPQQTVRPKKAGLSQKRPIRKKK